MFKSGGQRPSASLQRQGSVQKRVCVYDLRFGNREVPTKWLEVTGLDFNGFLQVLRQKFPIHSNETFVLVTTDRTVLDFDRFEELQDGSTLHLLQQENQALSVATKEHITFEPHYDTIIRAGTYEYYDSEGQKSLPYALAELIDNALWATAENRGVRSIEIRMLFDETLGKPAVIVLDNGRGMTSKQLKNWAVYRLSKFNRDNGKSANQSTQQGYVRPDAVPRSLNSDISFFGVGGKQAAFFIGGSTLMISKSADSPDVHELVLSEEDFKRKERNKEDIYRGDILHRKPCDSSHVRKDERFLQALIAEEFGKESFTAVVITKVKPEHITFLKENFQVWTRQLAHIYHYYIHGANGNDERSGSTNSDLPKLDIQITLTDKPMKYPGVIDLREVDDDMQTLYIRNAADTFEFRASAEKDGGTVEGLIRYHPFLYDRETYPEDPNVVQASSDNDDDDVYEYGDLQQTRKQRPIFECFWNGRLIPYAKVSEFSWCSRNKKSKVPEECYSRLSGVLFTDDKFEVTTNKLTFTDLETKLNHKETIFTRVVNGQKQRSNIEKEFTQWLQNCHERCDKQVRFLGYKETITRTDVPTKKMQHPWATFSSIEWDGKVYKEGQLVKSQKIKPTLYGTVVRFLLNGNYSEDVFATGGEVEVNLEPTAFHDKTKTILISRIDKAATEEAIKKNIANDFAKLPDRLKVAWPDGNPWPQSAVRSAGTPLGPLGVEILNKKEESISRMPSVGQGPVRKLIVELKVIQHSAKGDQEVVSFVAQHSPKWAFHFKRIENLIQLGKYTLTLTTAINESNATVFGGRELPSYKLSFTIKEGDAESFLIRAVSSTLNVGLPFNISLLIKDCYDHPATPPPNLKPELTCSGLKVSYEKVDISGTTVTIRGVKVRGKVNYQQSKPYDLKVTLPGMKQDTQSISIVLLPGKPHSLHVKTEGDPITAENGNPIKFNVEIHDEAGNVTAHPKQTVRCQVEGLPAVVTDCSSTGAGQLVTKPVNLKIIKGEPQKLKVQFDMPSQKNVASVMRELTVLPSTRVSSMELYSQDDENLVLRNKEMIDWLAGGLLENLFYRLYDEAGRELPLTPEIASKIKVNWTADVNPEDLVQGMLPDVQVPTQVQEQRFYQVSYQDQSVSVSFKIVPRPDEPARLKATSSQSTVRLGETLSENINLVLVDRYDNVTKALTPDCVNHMSAKAEDLDKSAITFTWQESTSSVLVTGVQFQSGTPGPREMCLTYRSFVEQVIINVTAGVPAQVKLVSEPEKPLQVLNGRGISTPFVVQLCDEWGNPSPDQRVVVELLSSPSTLKVMANVMSQPVNAEGKASFTVNNVSGPKGYYQLEFKGSFNLKPLPGPAVNLTVIPDPNKPVSLLVEYDTNAKFPAGGRFPVFLVTVVSDEGSPMTTFNPAAVSMFLWNGAPAGNRPPQMATELRCSKPMENEKNDCFHFRDKDIPEHVGNHTIQFSLRIDGRQSLFSNQIPINVVANQPVKLGPDSQPPPPVVSYSKAIASRTLVENMTLRIMDLYGNPAGEDLDGKVKVSIMNSSGDNCKILPLFEGKVNSFQFSLVEGKAHITRLAVMENSPGEDGCEYILLFKPEVSMVSTLLAPFKLPFHFCNDVENQRKMSELTKKKDELTKAVGAYKEVFHDYKLLLELLTNQYLDACRKEAEQRHELNSRNMKIAEHLSVADVDRLVAEKTAEVDRIQRMPRRVCTIRDNFRGQQDVLGMVGHLAFVQDDAAAWVIAWHIRGDMDCVITRTTAAAQRIYKDTQGRQQVMPLDSVLPPGHRPLPHIRNGYPLFNPPGNPVHARELLIYPQDKESCDIVFKNLLGDTILIDDLDSANSYRKAVVQNRTQCPTILTRQGDRVSARGKFGGTQNRAPPMNTLQVFGAPYPQQFYTLKEQLELLTQYRSALQKKDKAAKDREDHRNVMNSPDTLKKDQDMKDKERQLKEIERQCVSTPVRPVKRGPENTGEPSGIISKRARQRML